MTVIAKLVHYCAVTFSQPNGLGRKAEAVTSALLFQGSLARVGCKYTSLYVDHASFLNSTEYLFNLNIHCTCLSFPLRMLFATKSQDCF